nr:MFS transporter [uncultured Desulfobacter sp.]
MNKFSLFGLGTVLGGRTAPKLRLKMKNSFLVSAAVLGYVSLFVLSSHDHILALSLGFLGFGISFVFLQSTLVATVQEKLSGMAGTAMSVASFNFFLGGALGTWINGMVMKQYGIKQIFYHTSYMMLTVSILAALLISRFETRKRQQACDVLRN